MGNLPSVRSNPKMDEFCCFKVHLRLKKKREHARPKDAALESLDSVALLATININPNLNGLFIICLFVFISSELRFNRDGTLNVFLSGRCILFITQLKGASFFWPTSNSICWRNEMINNWELKFHTHECRICQLHIKMELLCHLKFQRYAHDFRTGIPLLEPSCRVPS